jgi:hypothetical protein
MDHVLGTGVPVNENDVAAGPALQPNVELATQVIDAVELLEDMVDTVRQEGISKADVEAVAQIVGSLKDVLPDLATTTGLEAYHGLFTPQRSFLNHQIAQESFVGKVKEIIRKLIDLGIKLYKDGVRWLKELVSGRKAVQEKTETVRGKVLEMVKLFKLLPLIYQPQTLAESLEVANLVMLSDKLPQNVFQKAAFGCLDCNARITNTGRSMETIMQRFEARFKIVLGEAKHGQINPDTFAHIEEGLGQAVVQVREFLTVDPEPGYFTQKVDNQFWMFTPQFDTKARVNVEGIVLVYEQAVKFLEELKRLPFESEQDVSNVKQLITRVTAILGVADEIIQGYVEMERAQLRYVVCYYNFYAQMSNVIHKLVISSAMSPDDRAAVVKTLEAITKAAR